MRSAPALLSLLCSLLPLAAPLPGQRPEVDAPEWHRARAIWFARATTPTVAAEICVGWGEPGKGASLGAERWAVLETFGELDFAGTKVPAGSHPLWLDTAGDRPELLFLDGAAIRKAHARPDALDASIPVVARVPLEADAGGKGALRFELVTSQDGTATVVMRTSAGTFRAVATVPGTRGIGALVQPMERGSSRIAFGKKGGAVLDHGRPRWNARLGREMEAMSAGKRWRFGNDWWTTLENDAALKIGGKTLPPGVWHLVLEKTDAGWNILCCPAAAQLAAHADAFAPQLAEPELTVPMKVVKPRSSENELAVGFVVQKGKALLQVAFGDHRLEVPVGG